MHSNFVKVPTDDKLDAYVPCRKCEVCRTRRMNMWGARGHAETIAAAQTWFLTLTLGREFRAKLMALAVQEEYRLGDIGAPAFLANAEKFDLWRPHVVAEVQRFWKRLRKAGYRFRYVCALEDHKDGVPHVHALVHMDAGSCLPDWTHELATTKGRTVSVPVANTIFSEWWGHGFTLTKGPIAKEDAAPAFYVGKYLSKSRGGRVHASGRYGRYAVVGNTRHE